MNSIVWLASYPKSGNTWLRVFLTNYLSTDGLPADINRLIGGAVAASRTLFDEVLGIESSDLTLDQIAQLRPIFHQHFATECEAPYFVKVHDAYSYCGRVLFPLSATRGVIYLVRNPLDIAVSFAHHENVDIDTIIGRMKNSRQTMSYRSDRLYDQLPQLLNSWSSHVHGWLDASTLPTHVVRYEDMLNDPSKTFSDIVRFSGLEFDSQRVQKSIEQASFHRLQVQESQRMFAERQPTAPSFFRRGVSGDWQSSLNACQVQQIIDTHRVMMQRFGYLAADGITPL